MDASELLASAKIVPVVVIDDIDTAVPLAECLAECIKRHFGSTPSALTTAMASKRTPIVERTHLLLNAQVEYSKPASPFSKAVVLSAFLVAGATIPVFAFDEANVKPSKVSKPDSESEFLCQG